MKSEKIILKNAKGLSLSARLELPVDKKPYAYALFAHCFTCTKNLTAVKNISQALSSHGIAVLRFDFTGLGESEGEFEDTNFSSNIQDLVDIAEYMNANLAPPNLMIGHSLGGAAAIYAANAIDSIEAVVTIGAPSSPQHIQHLLDEKIETIQKEGTAQVNIGGRPFAIKKQFLEDIASKNMDDMLSSMRKPILIFHSPQDQVVDISNAKEIYSNAHHPKSFSSLDGADHLLSDKRDSLYVGNVIAQWAGRYISQPKPTELRTREQVAVRIGKEGYTTDILAGQHSLTADEPEDVGGNDFGPSPYELLLSSLGACTAMTLRMYADRKKWVLEEVSVHLSHKKDYQDDANNLDEKRNTIDQISRTIELIGDLSSEQKERLIEIADKCPVHKTLHGPIVVKTFLSE